MNDLPSAATSARLDEAGRRFTALLTPLTALAQEEEAVRNLQEALLKTVRRLKALEQVVIPRLAQEVREVTATLEEEERDESIRHKIWLRAIERLRSGDSAPYAVQAYLPTRARAVSTTDLRAPPHSATGIPS